MKIKLLLITLFSSFSLFAGVRTMPAGEVSPFPAYDAYSQKPVTRGEIEKMLDSPEFQQLAGDMMPGASIKMSEEEKQAIIDDTLQFAQKMEALTPEEQQKELEDMFKQLPPPPMQPTPERKSVQQPVQPKPTVQPKTVPEKGAVSKKVIDLKKLLQKVVKALETIEISFDSMARVSSDNTVEHKWADVKEELPFTISTLKRIDKKEDLLERLASQEFKLLQSQLKELYDDLTPQQRQLAIADAAKLEKLSPADASRARPIDKKSKKASQSAVHKIVSILSRSIQNVNYGNKKLFEKYAPAELKEVEKDIQKGSAVRQTPTRAQAADSPDTGYGYYPGAPSYGRHTPYDGRSPYYDRRSRPATAQHPSFGPQRHKDGDKTQKGLRKEKDDQKKTPPTTDGKKGATKETDKDKKITHKTRAEADKALDEIQKTIDKLEKSAKKTLNEGLSGTLAGLVELDITDLDSREAINEARLSLQDINPVVTELTGDVSKFLSKIKDVQNEIKDGYKKRIKDYLEKQKETKRLVELAREFTKEEFVERIGDELEKINFIRYLNDFLSSYKTCLEKLQTMEMLQKKLADLNNSLDEQIRTNNVITIMQTGSEAQLSSVEFKIALTAALEQLAKYKKFSQRIADQYKATTPRKIASNALTLIGLLDSPKIPSEIRTKANAIKKHFS